MFADARPSRDMDNMQCPQIMAADLRETTAESTFTDSPRKRMQ